MAFEVEVGNINADMTKVAAGVTTLAQVAGDTVAARDLAIQVATQKIADLQASFDADSRLIAALNSQIAIDKAQLAQLGSVKVYRNLERNKWIQTFSAESKVGGGGKGTAGQALPGIECAETSIKPDAPIPVSAGGTGKNYFACYNHQDLTPDDSAKAYSYTWPFLLPSSADAAASQALEMEVRPILAGGLEFVFAAQLDFADKCLRCWKHNPTATDGSGSWLSTGIPQARLVPGTWYYVTLDCHRDDKTVFYDAITINGVKTPMTQSYPAYNRGWKQMLRVSHQLDGNGAGAAYRVKHDDIELRVSA